MAQPSRKHDVVYGRLFPWYFQVVAIALAVGAVSAVTINWILSLVLAFIAILIFTGKEGTEIDPVARTFREYTSFFFLKNGKPERYNGIDKIFINAGRISTTMYTAHTMQSGTFSSDEFRAFLKLDSGKKIPLKKSSDKEKLFSEMNVLAKALQTELVNATS